MSIEKRKILEMVRDEIITIEEAEELLLLLEKADENTNKKEKSKLRVEIKKELVKTKEELIKTKDKLVEKYNSIDTEKIKDGLKTGIEKIDNSVRKIDEAIINYGLKVLQKRKKSETDDEETLDPFVDENIDFYDSKANKDD